MNESEMMTNDGSDVIGETSDAESGEHDQELAQAAMQLSEPSLMAVWDNPEDDVYNDDNA